MIVRFTDDYAPYVIEGKRLLGRLMTMISKHEPYVGKTRELDKFYYIGIALTAMIDHFESDNNATPEDNEYLLQCLKKLLNKNIC